MKKTLALAIATLGSLAASSALAQSFQDSARVVSVREVHDRIPISREECWNDRQRGYEERRVTRTDTGAPIGAGTILGAVVGGVVGHQFGNSSGGRDRGTAAGAIVGGLIGHQVDKDREGGTAESVEVERVPVTRDVQRCRTIQEVREATVGYDVRYQYNGREFTARMDRDPGPRLRVRVDITPVEGRDQPGPRDGPRDGPRPPVYTR